ncbi:MAG: hypothetical protein Q9159_005321 [Coniocarpon cinnabarinum]
MNFARQTWTLTLKNLLIVFIRHWFATTFRALVLPIVFMFFISYAKNFFVPPSRFGIGTPSPVRSLAQGLNDAGGGRDTVVFVNNGFTDGSIGQVIDQLSTTVRDAGKTVHVLPDNSTLSAVCPSSLRGASQCYGAAEFFSSPNQGPGGTWSYKIRADGALGTKTYVDENDNDAQIYVLPMQHEIDRVIALVDGGTPMPPTVYNYPFTMRNQEERAANIVQLYQGTLIDVIAVAFFIAMVGVTYHLVGHVAMERELGMSQLIEAMMPNKRRWAPQVARLVAAHLSFDIMYMPGWVINGLIVAYLVFPDTDVGIIVGLHILGGLALSSWSLLFASFFRRAQLSGITTTIVSLVLAIIAQIPLGKNGSTGAVAILGLLFTPMNYTFFLIYVAGFQEQSIPTRLNDSTPASEIQWEVTGSAFFVIFAIQMLGFPLLALWVERSLYGTASKARKMHHAGTGDNVAVRLQGFSKFYGSSKFKQFLCFGRQKYKDVFKAVDNLNLNILQGQIAILLGANGSGKSTTLDAIAGLHEISTGSIDIDGRGGLGLCPQKNVLWDELTVLEHIWVFDRLKAPREPASKQSRKELISNCDLAIKTTAQAKTLSGGQKRKLQLAMMFCGGSKVCCVDEVSSGIDPLARRKVWDILLAERGRRTILLTTHFLDEADVLSDHIAILSKGILKADGTAVELKSRLGGGYQLSVLTHANFTLPPQLEHVPKRVDYDQTLYALGGSREVSAFIAELDRQGVEDYKVQGPTVESVFLRLADEIRDDLGMRAPSVVDLPPSYDETEAKVSEESSDEVAAAKFKSGGTLDLHTGHGTSLMRQSWILFGKRFTVLKRNIWPYAAAILIPIIAAGLVTLFLDGFILPSCAPGAQISSEEISDFTNAVTVDAPYGPPGAVSVQAFTSRYSALNASSLHTVSSLDAMNQYVTLNYHNVTPGGLWVGDTPTFAWLADYELESPILVQSLVDQLLTQTPITAQYQPFSTPLASQAGDSLQLILYFGLAMSAYPGFFALYPTAERLRKVRALHYSNGVRSLPIWSAYTLFDFIAVLVVSVLAVAIFAGTWDGWFAPGYLFVVFFLYGLTSVVYSYVVSLFVSSQLAAFAFSAGSQCALFLIYLISYMAIITYAPVNKIDADITTAHFTIALVTPSGSMLRSLLLTLNEFSILCHGFEFASYPGDITVYGGPILYLIIQFILLFFFLVWYDSGGRLSSLFSRRRHIQHDHDALAEAESTNAITDKSLRHELSNAASHDAGLRVLHLSKSFGPVRAVDDITFAIAPSSVFALLGPNGAGKSTTISLIRGDLRPTGARSEVNIHGANLFAHRVKARNNLGVCPQFDAMDAMTVSEHLLFYARARGVKDAQHNVHVVMHAVGLHPYTNRLAAKLSGGNKRKLSLAIALMGNPAVLLLDEPSSGMDAAAKRVMWRVLGSVSTGRALLITTHSMEEADALADRAGIVASRMLALGSTEKLRRDWGNALNVHLVHAEAPHTSIEEMERVKKWVIEHIPGAMVEDRTWSGQLRFSVPNHTTPVTDNAGGASASRDVRDVRDETEEDTQSSHSMDIEKPNNQHAGQSGGMTISRLFALLEENKEELKFAQYSVSPTTLDQVFLNVVMRHDVEEEGTGDGKKRRWWGGKR